LLFIYYFEIGNKLKYDDFTNLSPLEWQKGRKPKDIPHILSLFFKPEEINHS
jgi:hypothetical protein